MAAGAMLASCNQKEEIGEAKAVGANESYVVFAATGAPSQTLSVYADGSWAVDVNQPWIQVSPMTGQGMGSITVSVTDNATGGVIDSPREGTIILQVNDQKMQTTEDWAEAVKSANQSTDRTLWIKAITPSGRKVSFVIELDE